MASSAGRLDIATADRGAVPAYLRVSQFTSGQVTSFTAYTSTDGTTWTPVPGSTVSLTMSGSLAGFAITSHDQGNGSAVTLDSVSVTPGASPPPGGCPTGWMCSNVGGATRSGAQNLSRHVDARRWRR